MTNHGTCSRFEMAEDIVRHLELDDQVTVVPISSAEFPLPAPRARSEMMRNFKLELAGLDEMPHWRQSLERYIRENAWSRVARDARAV